MKNQQAVMLALCFVCPFMVYFKIQKPVIGITILSTYLLTWIVGLVQINATTILTDTIAFWIGIWTLTLFIMWICATIHTIFLLEKRIRQHDMSLH